MPEMSEMIPRQRNWASWVGFFLALAALFSNAGFFLGLPGEKAIPLLSLVLAFAAMACIAVGVMRAFRQPQVYGGKISSSILGVLSLLICALAGLAFIQSRALPAAAGAPQVGQKVPDFTLADTNGKNISLGELLSNSASAIPATASANSAGSGNSGAPKAVLLVFYRGHW
jgi:hypothetical protein